MSAAPTPNPSSITSPSPVPTEAETTGGETTEPALEPFSPVLPTHGGTYWGVYVEVADAITPAIRATIEARLHAVSPDLSATELDVNCDDGAAAALGVSGGLTWAVYFEDEAEARRLAAALDPPAAGVARVTTYCLD